jgi:hypothetical protein
VYDSLLKETEKFFNNVFLIYGPLSMYDEGFEEKKIIVSKYII